MATVVTVEKKQPLKPNHSGHSNKKEVKKQPPLFRKMNYILMGAGLLLLLIGYICLSGGGSSDNAHFSEAIFDTRRLVIAPIFLLLGLVVEIFAIMYHPRSKKKIETATEEQN